MTRVLLWSLPAWALIGGAVWAIPAWSQNGDTLLIRENPDGHLAEVYYMNSAGQSSTGVKRVYRHGEIEAMVHVRIGGGDVNFAEIIEVTPVDPQHMVMPAGPQAVMDGDEIVFVIMLPMF